MGSEMCIRDSDMVNAQFNLLDHFNIDKLFCVTGGSMGGMQVLQFIANYPDKSKIAIPIACSASHSAQNIAFNELGRQAIMADENWKNGNYDLENKSPAKGLSVARMAAHITYLSKKVFRKNLAENFKSETKLNLVLMPTFKLRVILDTRDQYLLIDLMQIAIFI